VCHPIRLVITTLPALPLLAPIWDVKFDQCNHRNLQPTRFLAPM
jgi:hypothetical protein